MHSKRNYFQILLAALISMSAETANATKETLNKPSLPLRPSSLPTLFDLKYGHTTVQLGVLGATQGKAQNINAQGLIGNQYSVNHPYPTNGLFGLGYYLDGPNKNRFQMSYGINAFYLGASSVTGDIAVEHYFTNLAYSYTIQHAPVYLAAKAALKNHSDKYNVTLDAGIGPNFMRTSHYNETPLTFNTVPENNNFLAHSNVAFTASAGIGLRLNNIFGNAPLECGYRFLYLGQGQLQMNNDQLLNNLKTGNTYANALLCALTV